MNEVDFIKWLCEKAEEFQFSEDISTYDHPIRIVMYKAANIYVGNACKAENWDFYPLLLQRAIEGVNKEYYNEGSKIKPLYIKQVPFGCVAGNAVKNIDKELINETYDKSKEAALKWVYEQEKQ